MNVERELNCEGYWGFGGGYAMAKGFVTYPDGGLYCNVCPLSQSCWEKHKARVATLLPDLVGMFERMAQDVQGPELVRRWHKRFKVADPYTSVLGGNVEDGAAVAKTGRVRERKEFTLPYPFTRPGPSPRDIAGGTGR